MRIFFFFHITREFHHHSLETTKSLESAGQVGSVCMSHAWLFSFMPISIIVFVRYLLSFTINSAATVHDVESQP